MEDKRTLLAFLLIGLILLLMEPYYEWMGLSREPLAPETEQTDEAGGRPSPAEQRPPGEPQIAEPVVTPTSPPAALAPPPAAVQLETAFVSRNIRINHPALLTSRSSGSLCFCDGTRQRDAGFPD